MPAVHFVAAMPRPSKLQPPPLKGFSEEPLGERIARLRKERGFTQVELAERMGIIQVLVSDYERGKLRPHPEMVARFAVALDVTADEVLGLGARKASRPSPNRRFLRRLEALAHLPKRDQDALLRTIDAFLALRAGRGSGRAA